MPIERPQGASTNADGYYFILNVRPGLYVLKATMIGYSAVIQRPVLVESDRTITVNFQLPSAVLEMGTVTVTAKRDVIKADVAATQEMIGTTRIEQMPVVRVDEFVNKLKGIELVSGADGYGLSVRGGSIRETDVRLDGISLQDPRSENSYLALNSTAIQEIQVLTGGFEAKYGGIRSGLLNVITKDGHRDRYTVSLRTDVAPAHQFHFFGTNPYSEDSWIYRVYAGQYAWRGVPAGDTTVPAEFRTFRGWAYAFPPAAIRRLDSLQRQDLWLKQHPMYPVAEKPDIFFEGTVTGPFPGAGLPFLGDYAENTTFLLGFKYEDSQLAFPLGPRDDYLDWNSQLKLTTRISDQLKLSVNGMYAKVSTVSGGATTSYGGALVDQSSSFSFLNSTRASVQQQARLLAGNNLWQLFNKSRLQFYDQRYVIGGAKLTHTFAQNAFYTVDFQLGYTDQQLQPFALDTSRADAWIEYVGIDGNTYRFLNAPSLGTPNGSTNPGTDALNMFRMYGGLQRVDSSYSWVMQLKGDLTMQLGRHNQVEAGFSARLQNLFVYSGTWLQAQLSYTPDLWQYYRATPLDGGVYVQDKLEFEGMILNAGVRADFLDPMKKGFDVQIPPDADYRKLYNSIYQNLPGAWGSYDRWVEFRDLLENPPGWPRTRNRIQVLLAPRLGVSFPVTENSKMYFNYGHFFQRPPVAFMYDQVIDLTTVTVPTPDLDMGRTISYEFGYEQVFLSQFLVNVTAYYKDIRNEPLQRLFVSYYNNNNVYRYFPDAYGDIRGVELRFERTAGRFVTFHAMLDYMLQSRGRTGRDKLYENQLDPGARNELRNANITTTDPLPRANINLNLHTPLDWGPTFLGMPIFGGWYATLFFEWKDGGKFLWNPTEPDIKKWIYVDVVDYWNIDFRGSKVFPLGFGDVEFVVTITNLTNNKWLNTSNMLQTQFDAYKASLKLPFQGGSDTWGEWKSEGNHFTLAPGADNILPQMQWTPAKPNTINTGWFDAPIFLNPRRIILGMRVNF